MVKHDEIKVLVVDDSALMRKMITDILQSGPNMKVVGTASNGHEAIEKVKLCMPDVITMDVEMPMMNGLEALRRIMSLGTYKVVMISSQTEKDSEITVKALELGAIDFIAKPSGSVSVNINKIADEIIAKIILAHKSKSIRTTGRIHTHDFSKFKKQGVKQEKIVVIGSSTGGPQALKEVLPNIPADLPAKFVVVQHMPAKFTSLLAIRLNKQSNLLIEEAKNGDKVEAGKILLAPGDFHMRINRDETISLNQDAKIWGVRPSVEHTLESAVDRYGAHVISVVLTGMGHDGSHGVQKVKKAGGYSIVESEETCVIYGMPKTIVDQGNADEIVRLENIPEAIVKAIYR